MRRRWDPKCPRERGDDHRAALFKEGIEDPFGPAGDRRPKRTKGSVNAQCLTGESEVTNRFHYFASFNHRPIVMARMPLDCGVI
jgi:hypothetical protein